MTKKKMCSLLICIEESNAYPESLTIGKVYRVLDYDRGYFKIIDNNGNILLFKDRRFKLYNINKLLELLEE